LTLRIRCLCSWTVFAAWPCRFVVPRRLLCRSTCGFDVFAVWPVWWRCFCRSTLQICRPETSPLQFNLVDSISLWCNYDLHFVLPLWRRVLFLPRWLRLCMSPFSVTIMNFCMTPFYALMIFCIISADLRNMHCFRVCVRIECSS
jgi:hypothetical protein